MEEPSEFRNDVGSIRSGSTSTRYRHFSSIQGPPPPPKKSWKKRFMDGFRATVAFVFSKVGICVLVIGYLFVGAAMFQQLEGRVMTNSWFQSVIKYGFRGRSPYNDRVILSQHRMS